MKQNTLMFVLVLCAVCTKAQTYVSSNQLTGAIAPGQYYNNSSIRLVPNTSITPGAGQSVKLYISNTDCIPLSTNISKTRNYILTSVPRIPNFDPSNTAYFSCDVMQRVEYFDGLGRPAQTIQIKGSPANKDVVQPFAYDASGRESQKYLPYVSTTDDGSYKTNALSEQSNFYNAPPAGVTPVKNPYAVTVFEPSPLNRILETGGPGVDWQPLANSTAGHTSKIVYTTNNVTGLIDTANSMLVALYTVTINPDQSRTLVRASGAAGNYPAGELAVTIQRNENWKNGRGGTSEEYKDKDGHVVLKRMFNFTNGVLQMISTYYVYDDLDNLAFVLTPKSNADVSQPSQDVLNSLCYQYQYDERNRLIQKKMPGADWEYSVYNTLDQIVASQDGNQHINKQWVFNKYDVYGRILWTGIWNNGGTAINRPDLQSLINGLTTPLWDSRPTGGYPTNLAWPTSGYVGSLTVNYYDDYTFPDLPPQYDYRSSASIKTKGLPTCTKTWVLGSSGVLYTVFYYDDLGRNIKTYKQHYLAGTTGNSNFNNFDIITNTYDFSNTLISTTRQHYNTTSSNPVVSISNKYDYDHTGRKINNWEQINNDPPVLLSNNIYNEMGQLLTKNLHSENNGSSFLQSVNYGYNEKGWLKSATSSANIFNYSLYYNDPTDNMGKLYNGNISEMIYTKTGGPNMVVKYSYDLLNRLNNAVSADNTLNETISYDLMGNITNLTRTGGANAVNLNYTYYNNSQSNQLQTITNSGAAFRNYAYDYNGNATSDGVNKNISYNLLNLPQSVTQGNNTLGTYIYDAAGNKLHKTGTDGTWDYVDGIVYNNNVISFIKTEEGRVVPIGNSYHYEYDLTDHLGNVRYSFDKDPNTGAARRIQEDEYYAFGLRRNVQNFSNDNHYLYNGKEIQADLSNQYDYGTRFYDPVIARWTSVDPAAEKGRAWSPYAYVFDNPIRLTDPEGDWPGVTFIFFQGNIGAGLGVGLYEIQQSGIAFDSYGKTHFTVEGNIHVVDQNGDNAYGADIGISAGGTQDWNARSFIESLHEASQFSGPIALPSLKGALGLGFAVNKNSLSLTIGLAAGLTLSEISMRVKESVSLSDQESDKINSMTDVWANSWMVRNISPTLSNNGTIVGFQGTVFTRNTNGDLIDTGITVNSKIQFDDDNIISDNIWMSAAYETLMNQDNKENK